MANIRPIGIRTVHTYSDILIFVAFLVNAIYILQQNSAPAHRARATIDLLEKETLPTSTVAPHSLDLNPVDYSVRGILREN